MSTEDPGRPRAKVEADRAEDAANRASAALAEIKATPAAEPVEVLSRIVYAICAFAVTYGLMYFIFGLPKEGATEVAVLNGGVAYYTHEAAGRVVAAMNIVYRRWRRDQQR